MKITILQAPDSSLRNRLENTMGAHERQLSTYEERALREVIEFLESLECTDVALILRTPA